MRTIRITAALFLAGLAGAATDAEQFAWAEENGRQFERAVAAARRVL
jgi:hypothetical protein